MSDPVQHPSHYSTGRFTVECIAITRYMTFCAGNAAKYVWRHAEKNGLEDLRKAIVYLRWAIGDGYTAILPEYREHVLSLIESHVEPYAKGVYLALIDIADSEYESALRRIEAEIERLEGEAS